LKNLKVAYIGDANNVCNQLVIGCGKMGIDIAVASPPEYTLRKEILTQAMENARESESSIEVSIEPAQAVKNAHVVYTDVFVSMGFEHEKSARLVALLPKYQVTADIFEYTSEHAIFMHCLSAHRGEEVSDDVIDGPRSIVWDQAENRLHTEKAILAYLL